MKSQKTGKQRTVCRDEVSDKSLELREGQNEKSGFQKRLRTQTVLEFIRKRRSTWIYTRMEETRLVRG